ncbi:MAG: hypothetical protein JW894_09575 [Bacteroidales bacterium]|nr:hypothetical protein [Bacteroidales bacterium]
MRTLLFTILISHFLLLDAQNKLLDTRDSNEYNTVQIGNMIWMAENLNYNAGEGAVCYNNTDSNCVKYGRLYVWEVALKSCPSGWHLPTDEEWKKLEVIIGMDSSLTDIVGTRGNNEGISLNEGGNSGFEALFGGYRLWWDKSYHYLDHYGDYWAATEDSKEEAWYRNFSKYDPAVYRNRINKKYAYSVRCVKD